MGNIELLKEMPFTPDQLLLIHNSRKGKVDLVFDTETTGLPAGSHSDLSKQPYITEICAYKFVDGVFEDVYSTLIKVPVPLSSKIIELTGITDELLDDAPSFVEQLDEMKEFFKGADRWVAHNIDFDSKMMYFQLARHGHEFKFPWPLEKYCTLKVGKAMQAQNPSMGNAKLATVYKFLTGKDQQEAHRAEADVKVLTEVYFNMLLRP